MTAADPFNDDSYAWVEETEVQHRPAFNEFSPSTVQGTSSMTRANMSEANYDESEAPQEARISSHWSSVSPSLHTPQEITMGLNFPPPPGVVSPRAGGDPDAWEAPRQGTLFKAGREVPPTVGFMESTRRSRFATMGGLGALANNVKGVTGKTVLPSTDLSPHSAPLVSRITGEEKAVTNSIDFVEPGNREMTELPRKDIVGEVSPGTTYTHRFVPDKEIAAGKATLVTHMRAMRSPRPLPAEQLTMGPDPGGPSAAEAHQSTVLELRRSIAAQRRARRTAIS